LKNTWKNTVFLRLFLMFLLIITPLCGIGISIYNWGVHAIKDEIYKSMIAQVNFYLDGLDTEIQRMKILHYESITDEDLNRLTFAHLSMNEFEKSQGLLRLQQRLNAIKSSSRYISDASVSIIGLNTTISSNDGIMSMDKGELEFLKGPYLSSRTQMIFWNGSFYLNVSSPLGNKNMQKLSYIIKIRLLEKAFKEDLNQFNTYENSLSMVTGKVGEFILVNGKESYPIDNMRSQLGREMEKSPTGTYYEKINGKKYLAIYSTSEYLGLSLTRYIPERAVFSRLNRYQIWLWVFALVSLGIIVLFSISIYNFIHKPLHSLMEAFKKVENGDWKVNIEHRHNDEFRHLYRNFNMMVGNLGTLIDQVYKQKILMQNAELKQLQAQINPHFLYNTFFMLYSIARAEDYENVMSFLQQLGSYFKFITRNGEAEVPLYKEVEHARTYTNIQALRFSRRISIDFEELPEKYRNLMVPRLIIQPIIENSFKYGLEEKASEGMLFIRFREFGDFLCIIIEDNGNGMNSSDMISLKNALANKEYEGEVTGVVNIHKRLQLKFGANSGLVIANSEIGGLMVVMNLELEENGNV
jgi:two-component system, sensor histidine kinase YesM